MKRSKDAPKLRALRTVRPADSVSQARPFGPPSAGPGALATWGIGAVEDIWVRAEPVCLFLSSKCNCIYASFLANVTVLMRPF